MGGPAFLLRFLSYGGQAVRAARATVTIVPHRGSFGLNVGGSSSVWTVSVESMPLVVSRPGRSRALPSALKCPTDLEYTGHDAERDQGD